MANLEGEQDPPSDMRDPDFDEVIAKLADASASEGPLDGRIQQLLRLAVAIGFGADEGIRNAAVEAALQGWDPAAIDQTVLLAFKTVGSAGGLDVLTLVRDSLGKPPERS